MQRTGHFAFYEEGLLHLALGLHALLVVEDLLADAQVLGSDLQQLVLSQELEAALGLTACDRCSPLGIRYGQTRTQIESFFCCLRF